MTGIVEQVSISRGGLPKYAVAQARVGPLGLEGDGHYNMQVHGGPRQAVLIVCAEAIEALQAKGYPVYFGALGENVTTRGLDHRQFRVGQRYRLGDAFIELTKLRTPCTNLDVYGPAIKNDVYDKQVKANDSTSPRWGMGGIYAAVLRPGLIRPKDIISLVDQAV